MGFDEKGKDVSRLKEQGVDEVFLPGSRLDDMIDYVKSRLALTSRERS